MVSERLPNKMTVAEYLAYEQETNTKYEFIDGNVYAMAGGSRQHNAIATNYASEFRDQLRPKPWQSFNSDVKVKISDIRYVYPDFTVVCDEQNYADEAETMLTNPTLVGEVMSPSSADYDQGTKATYYRSLPSLKVYLLIAQDRPYVQVYTRNDIGWQLREYSNLGDIISLNVIDCELKLSEIYLDVF